MSHLDRAVRALRWQYAMCPWVVRVDADDSSGFERIVVWVRDLRREVTVSEWCVFPVDVREP
jgi:hypothetical protein